MLSHYDMNAGNGVYTLAHRAVDIATMPIYSLVAAAMPRFFRKGVDGLPEAAAFARRLWKRSFVFSLVAALGLFGLAPLVPRFVGHSFAEAAPALQWLCLIPVFRGVHEIQGIALTRGTTALPHGDSDRGSCTEPSVEFVADPDP